MWNLYKNIFSAPTECGVPTADSNQSGSILIYIVVVMLIFGFLGAGMVSMFTSSTMMSSGVANYSRNAAYLAEAAMRYATSELRNEGYNTSTIEALNGATNDKTFTLGDDGNFQVNVFGKWFKATGLDYDETLGGTISLTVPEGKIPEGFSIPAGAYLVNLESYRDSVLFGGSPDTKYWAQISTSPDLNEGDTDFTLDLNDDFQADVSQGHKLLISVKPTATVTIGPGDAELTVGDEAWNFYPPDKGSIYLVSTDTGTIHEYYYEDMVQGSTKLNLVNLPGAIEFKNTDFVILSNHNHSISTTGNSGTSISGGMREIAMNFAQNVENPQIIAPPAEDIAADVDPEAVLEGMGTVGESDTGAVDVNTGTGEITLGGGVPSASGAVFFGGDVSLGGSSVCSGGKCLFGAGVRASFVLTYNGTADGFTFAVINGADNVLGTAGDEGGQMGYAGSGIGGGLQPPKMALEFDTWVNAGHDDPDLGTSHRDVLQYVFWGDGQADLDDDNTHDTGGAGRKWRYKDASYADEVKTKPALNSDETALYFSSKNGYVHELDPETGVPPAVTGFPLWLYGDTESSPAWDSDGYIFIGGDDNYFNAITPTGGFDWYANTSAAIKSSPVIDDDNQVVYFGNDDGYFYAYNNSGPPIEWTHNLADDGLAWANIRGTPALSPDKLTVYFATEDTYNNRSSDYLFALKTSDGSLRWKLALDGDCFSSPTVADDGTIYIGGDGGSFEGLLFAVNPDGSEKWRYTFSPNNARSKPAIDPEDGTIYIGNDDDHLYAITDNESEGILKWRFHTLDDDGSPLGENVRGGPTVHADGTIWFGSNNNRLYVVDGDGLLIDKFDLSGDVLSSPTQGTDGTVYVGSRDHYLYAYKATCNPGNIKTRVFSYDDLLPGDAAPDVDPADGNPDVVSADNWLNSGPWAVRIEIDRSETVNDRDRYEYTLSTWIRQCQNANCSDITPTYFADTRIDYNAREPHLVQTVELCAADHADFNRFLYGFTQGTGGETQTVVIDNLNLGFIRPGDAVITSDPNWQ